VFANRLVPLLLCLCACASTSSAPPPGDDDPIDTPVEIVVKPADLELLIDGATAATATYTALGRFADGRIEDVSSRVQWLLTNAELGGFAGSQFTSTVTRGGRSKVVATLGAVSGESALTLRIRERYPDPGAGLPADPSGPFGGPANPGRAPDLVYPNDGVLVPPNLRLLEIHFKPGAGNTLFEISFHNDLSDIVVYTRCVVPLNGGCIYTPDATVWTWIAETNRGGDDLTVGVRATDDAGSGVGASAAIKLAFSVENVKGGIYYWTAGKTAATEIMRYDFGSVTQLAAERFVGPDQAGGKCVGCHALSRDGTKMVAAAGGWDVEDSLLVDVGRARRVATPAKSAFSSWNPTGSTYVGVFAYGGAANYNLMLFDGASGHLTGTIDVGATAAQAASHPDWSPDGTSIAFVREGAPDITGVNNQRFFQGAIQIVTDQGGGAFGAPETIVPAAAGKNRYYPAFAPDSKLLAFNESTCPTGSQHKDCNADTDPSAKIFVVAPHAGATPIALAHANAPGKTDTGTSLTNSWPKWAPFEFQRTETAGTRLVWLTFSSSRNYGLRKPPPGGVSTEATSGTLLWMVAIDPDRAAAGQDPSYAAFALPFQDVATSNHIAQWTEEVVVLQ